MPIGNRIVVFLFIFVVIPSYPRAERSELSIIGLKTQTQFSAQRMLQMTLWLRERR